MNYRVTIFIIVLAVVTVGMGWLYSRRPTELLLPTPVPLPSVTPTPAPAAHTKAEIGQLLMLPLSVNSSKTGVATTSATLDYLQKNQPYFVLLFGDRISSTSAQAAAETLQKTTGRSLALVVDHEGGSVQRLSGVGFTRLPSWQEMCALRTEERAELFARSAAELKEVGVRVVLAPVVDVAQDHKPLSNRICSNEKTTVTAVAQEFIEAFQAKGILPVIKHYPGIGGTTQDLHNKLDAVVETPGEITIYQSLLKVYPTIGVMTAHVLVKDLAENAPCSLDPVCLRSLKKLAPEALIFTDALEMESALTGADLVSKKTLTDVSREALLAGNHVLVYGKGVTATQLDKIIETLGQEYDTNELLRIKINQALDRVAAFKAQETEKTATTNK